MAVTVFTFECNVCRYRWINPDDGTPDVCPRCRLLKEIIDQAKEAQIPFSGYSLLKPGKGIEFNTPDGWIIIEFGDNHQLFIQNEYKKLFRPIKIGNLKEELWYELKDIQKHVTEKLKEEGVPFAEVAMLPDGMKLEDIDNDQNESPPQRQRHTLSRAERRRQLKGIK